MPHLIVESSQALSEKVINELHKEVGQQETVSMKAVKIRFYSPAIHFCGEEIGKNPLI